jgi:hypothetical protein
MSLPANTYLTTAAVGQREDLSDMIYNIAPVDTLFSSKIAAATATGIKHEYQTDTLAAAGANAHSEGEDADAGAIVPTVRLSNTCQIQKKIVQVSGTLEKVKKAGRQSEIDYQVALKMKELAKDVEYAFLQAVESTGDPRQMDGALNRVITNLDKNDGTLNADGTVTGGTARPLLEDIVKGQLQNAFTQGGNIDTIYVAPYNKAQISGWVSTGNTRRFVEEKKLINSVDVYESDFGMIAIKPHRNFPTSVAFGVDHKYWKKATLRPTFKELLAKTGDSTKYQILVEHTIEDCQQASSFRITNLTTSVNG